MLYIFTIYCTGTTNLTTIFSMGKKVYFRPLGSGSTIWDYESAIPDRNIFFRYVDESRTLVKKILDVPNVPQEVLAELRTTVHVILREYVSTQLVDTCVLTTYSVLVHLYQSTPTARTYRRPRSQTQ
jgi:hypothetical protein